MGVEVLYLCLASVRLAVDTHLPMPIPRRFFGVGGHSGLAMLELSISCYCHCRMAVTGRARCRQSCNLHEGRAVRVYSLPAQGVFYSQDFGH